MKSLVISLGGSVLVPNLSDHRIKEYAAALRRVSEKHRVFVVVGGGGEARKYIDAVRTLGVDEGTCDEIGILVTRLNATLLVAALGDSVYPCVAVNQDNGIGICSVRQDCRHGWGYPCPDHRCSCGGTGRAHEGRYS